MNVFLAVVVMIVPIGAGFQPIAGPQQVRESAVMPPTSSLFPGAVANRENVAPTGEVRSKSTELASRGPLARGKTPVFLVQGLLGSPRLWEPMVRALEADPCVGGRFHFLTFAYPTGQSIPHSALLLRRELQALRDRLDPDRSDPSRDRMVLIGHSMEGILCKMMAQESGSKLWDPVTDRPPEDPAGTAESIRLLRKETIFKLFSEIRRIIFIATPHKGSSLVSKPIRSILSMLAGSAEGLRQTRASRLTARGPGDLGPERRTGLPMTIDQLTGGHPLLQAIDSLSLDPGMKWLSIIADQRNPPRPDRSDDLVPYASSHLADATSELLVSGGHYCLGNPDVIGEVARVLKQHAKARDCTRAFPAMPIVPESTRKPPPQTRRELGGPISRNRAGAKVPALDEHAPCAK
jgi:pimeloyl-ACP methyl ester carboxylesterase